MSSVAVWDEMREEVETIFFLSYDRVNFVNERKFRLNLQDGRRRVIDEHVEDNDAAPRPRHSDTQRNANDNSFHPCIHVACLSPKTRLNEIAVGQFIGAWSAIALR